MGSAEVNIAKPEVEVVEDCSTSIEQKLPLETDWQAAQRNQTVLQAIKENPRPLAWCLYMLFTVVMWGYDGLAGGIVLAFPQFRMDYGEPYQGQYVVPAKWQLAFTAASTIGLLIGGPPAAYIAKYYGRQACLWVGYCFTIAGVFLQWFSKGNLPMFFGSKLMTGLPLGLFITICPTYCAEIAPFSLRGSMVAAVNWSTVLGQLIGYGVMRQTQTIPGSLSYQTLFAVQWGFAGAALCVLPFLPETPYYWVGKGKVEQAKRSILRIWGKDADVKSILETVEHNMRSEGEEKAAQGSFAQCFKGKNLRRTFVAVSGLFIQQMVGTQWVLGYMAYFLQLGGLDPLTAFNTSFGLVGVMLVGNMFGWVCIEKFGRRTTAVYGSFILALTLIMIGVTAVIPTHAAIWGQVAFMAIWSFVYQATMGSVSWTIVQEIPTSSLRQHTQALATVTTGISGTAWAFVLPYMVNPDEANLGGKSGFVFGGITIICAVLLFFYLPETKGRSYQDIDILFESGIPARKFKQADVRALATNNAARDHLHSESTP